MRLAIQYPETKQTPTPSPAEFGSNEHGRVRRLGVVDIDNLLKQLQLAIYMKINIKSLSSKSGGSLIQAKRQWVVLAQTHVIAGETPVVTGKTARGNQT